MSTIKALIEGLNLGHTDKQLAEHLNSKDLLSPTGAPWTMTAITQALFKFRNHRTRRSTLHRELLQLAFDGLLSPADTLPLFQPRNVPRLVM